MCSGYDQKYNIKFLRENGYTPLIWHNKRNCKNDKIIKERKFDKHQIAHYKQRHIIETLFSWLECKIPRDFFLKSKVANFVRRPRLIKMFDKKINNYLNLAYLACADILFSKLMRLN